MVFSSYVFLFLFLPVVCIVYFILPTKGKNIWLLLSSLFFYGWNAPAYLPVLLLSIAVNYLTGQLIDTAEGRMRKGLLITGIAVNIGILAYFKYANFIVRNIGLLSPGFGDGWQEVILPLGISFFTFQGMSYTIDVYRKDTGALRNPLDVALYISLFPQLVAGPIVRFKSITSQIHGRKSSVEGIGHGFRRFIFGFSKKMLLADTFGMVADSVFADATSWNMGTTWIGIIAYTLQIYYDFSGYSDMAIGLGSIFGFHFEENFNYPYAAASVTEFWHRWHISLSTWFRDYVYIPLGGSRVKAGRHVLNIMIVWLLTGIWHGAEWTFFVWGIYYGILLLVEKYAVRLVWVRGRDNKHTSLTPLRWMFTMLLVMIGWVFFRADNMRDAIVYLQAMFSFKHSHMGYIMFARHITNYAAFWIAGLIGIFPVVPKIKAWIRKHGKEESVAYAVGVNVIAAVLLILSIMFLVANTYNAFIYFQF